MHRAQRPGIGVGGHISTYASAVTLYEVGQNHFWRGQDAPGGGDQVFFQGHAAPGRGIGTVGGEANPNSHRNSHANMGNR